MLPIFPVSQTGNIGSISVCLSWDTAPYDFHFETEMSATDSWTLILKIMLRFTSVNLNIILRNSVR